MLEFRILGPLEAVEDGTPVLLGGPRQRATLAILLLHANRVVSIERLADDLYAGAPPLTAVAQVQRQISALRAALGPQSGIETRAPGYLIHVVAANLDLSRFEAGASEAAKALARGDTPRAADLLGDALALWRGAPLADLAYESFAQVAIGRLEDVRLAAVELRIEAELALGRHNEWIPELTSLVAEHPLREGLSAQLMLALYRAGRQAEALGVYHAARAALVEQFGIEPTSVLRALERAILNHDPALDATSDRQAPPPERTVLVLPSGDDRLEGLLALAQPLATLPSREIIIARLVADEHDLGPAAVTVNARRASLATAARCAVFTSSHPADDIARLVAAHGVDLVLIDAPYDLDAALPDDIAAMVERSPADLGMLTDPPPRFDDGNCIFVPFGGGEHDWAALELAGWLGSATGTPLRLVGTTADPRTGRRDASRLLADASLAVQRAVGVATEPVLTERSEEGLLAAVASAAIVVAGISEHWRRDGIGPSRRALVRRSGSPILLVHRGLRPGGLAPRESRTRFTWTLDAAGGQ